MIYLIKTSVFIEDEQDPSKDKAVLALKIGYSNDSRGMDRFQDYRNSGLDLRILKTIPGGSLLLESKVQLYFKDHRIPSKSREWFYYTDEIVNVFNCFTDISDLYKLLDVKDDKELFMMDLSPRQLNRLRSEESMKKFEEDHPDLLDGDVYDFLLKIKDSNTYSDRMKYLCENELSEGDFNLALEYIPEELKTYYLSLGPNRCKSLRYRQDLLQKEYSNLSKKQTENLYIKIADCFTIGERYSMSDIKQRLVALYNDIGLSGKPTAKLLEDVFELKTCNIPNPYNPQKRGKGFEILSLKPPKLL